MTNSSTQENQNNLMVIPKESHMDTIAGVGGGTLLAALAQHLPDSSQIKIWLILLAPALTVGGKTFYAHVRNWLLQILRDKKIEKLYQEHKTILEQHINDSASSAAYKAECRKKLEELNRLYRDAKLKEMTKVVTASI